MTQRQSLQYIEIDIPTFVATSPETLETYRFTLNNVDYLPQDIDAIPSLTGIDFSPARISLGQNLGERAVLTCTFRDHQHIFASEAFESGTFFGKLRARHKTRLRNRALRWYQGEVGQDLADMTVHHYIIDNVSGPTPAGQYTIVAKDVLKLTDDDRAQAPVLSQGFLSSNITAGATSATLSPSGIGDTDYPASGRVAIAGEEIADFTRSGDVLTLTRGQLNTTAVAHEAGDRVQLVLEYSAQDPADVIRDLLVTYGNVPSSYINLTTWTDETAAHLQRLYTAVIAEPVSVRQLVSEVIEQAALSLWWDAEAQQLRLRVLKNILTSETFDEDNTLENSLQVAEQPNTRISQVWTYFGERNALEPLDEPNNFRSVEIKTDLVSEADFGTPAIKKIFSRWIPFGGRSIAQRVNDIQLARFVDPPRKFVFRVSPFAAVQPTLGDGFIIKSWSLQNTDGTPAEIPAQITRLKQMPGFIECEAEEALFAGDPVDLVNRVIIIDTNEFELNLRTLHDVLFPDPTGLESPAISVTFIVEEGITVGSQTDGVAAMRSGLWVPGVVPLLRVRGRVQGRGGNGGPATIGSTGNVGGTGSDALLVEDEISLDLTQGDGEVFSGAGGGASVPQSPTFGSVPVGGGGGAGTEGGTQGGNGSGNGTRDAGGGGATSGLNTAGSGGAPGLAGGGSTWTNQSSQPGSTAGGQPGNSINGVSLVTFVGSPIGGDIRGPQIN